MNKQDLIKEIREIGNYSLSIFGNEIKGVPTESAVNLIEQLDEPQPLKLKDIIRRMKQLFPNNRSEWIADILHEFGEEFGSMKYREGYEQGKFEGEWVGNQLKDADKIRQELNKPVVKQFVADWYEKKKHDLNHYIWDYIYNWNHQEESEFKKWMNCSITSFQTLVNMHQFGYEVEEEKRYRVKMKKLDKRLNTLNQERASKDFVFSELEENSLYATKFTRKQLEEAGFGEVFNSPLFEVVEVE